MLAPPLLVSYSSVDEYLSALPDELSEEFGDEIRQLVAKGLPPIVSSRCLATLFGYSTKFVNAMALRNYKYYREFKIKKGKKKRVIQAPKVSLKVIQKWFGHHLAAALPMEDYVYGFVPGRSAVDAAAKHCESDWVYSIDIENFFPSTNEETVMSALTGIGYSEKAARVITPLCCYFDVLAQGAPSSPVLSNLVMKPVDAELNHIAEELGLTFTRYADDIVFSGAGEFPQELKERSESVFKDTCWTLSKQKEYLAQANKGQRLKVHGLLVNNEAPRLTKGYRNKVRAFKHMLETNKVKEEDIPRLKGHVDFADSVDKR